MRSVLAALSLLAAGAIAAQNHTSYLGMDTSAWNLEGDWVRTTSAGVNKCTGADWVWAVNHTGARVSVDFTGTAVYLQVTFSRDRGLINIALDGESQGEYPSWDDSSKRALCGILFAKDGLSNSKHTLSATMVEEHNGFPRMEIISITYTTPDAEAEQPPQNTVATTNPPQQTTKPPETSAHSLPSSVDTHSSSQVLPSSSTNTPLSSPSPPAPSGSRADILVTDPRIQWSPPDAWADAGSNASRSSCTTGTRVSYKTGAALAFPFRGNSISLAVVPSSSSGFFRITLDGQIVETLNGFTNDSVGMCNPLDVYEKSGLPDTDHVLVVTVVGTSNSTEADGTRLEIAGLAYYGAESTSTSALLAQAPTPNNNAAIIGGSVGGALGVLIFAGLVAFTVHRRRARQRKTIATMEEMDPYLRQIVFGPQSYYQSAESTPPFTSNAPIPMPAPGSGSGGESPDLTQPPLAPGLLGLQIVDNPYEPHVAPYSSPPPYYGPSLPPGAVPLG